MSSKAKDHYSSPWLIVALLFICIFSPYGTFASGGGTLRLDHVAVPAIFAYVAMRGRLRLWPPLLTSLIAFVVVTLLATVVSLEVFMIEPLLGLKNLDGTLRGPLVLAIALTIRPSPESARLVLRAFVIIATTLALFALADRLLPIDHPMTTELIRLYGGGISADAFGMNHKHQMLLESRATAVFFTPPSLSMVCLFFIAAGLTREAPMSIVERNVLIVAGLIGGVASNSKSFVFGIGVLALLLIVQRQPVMRRLGGVVFLAASAALLIMFAGELDPERSSNPFTRVVEAENVTSGLTGGRFGDDEWDANEVVVRVLDESPLFGYGLGEQPGVIYSDSGLNKLLLHGGALGALLVFIGICAQLVWFTRDRTSGWSRLGFQVLAVALALFAAGPIFMMARVNDVLFSIIGISISLCIASRRQRTEVRAAAAITPSRGLRPTSAQMVG